MPNLEQRKRTSGFLGSSNLRASSYFDNSKKILNVNTGKVYKNMENLCDILKITKAIALKQMKHKVDLGEEYTFTYIDNNGNI